MISIIISTHNPECFEAVKASIENTIGVAYEIIAIENHKQYSLCNAYNLGYAQAKYQYLCFLHEDVVFITQGWGTRLIALMSNDKSIGLIGIAGSKFKSTYPTTGWGTGPFIHKFWKGHYYTYLNDEKKHIDLDISPQKTVVEDVLIVDGVFLFTKREVFQYCRFDDKLLTNFHGYDTDFSLQVYFQLYRVVVDRGLELIHYSFGDTRDEFANANRKILKKWLPKLPVATKDCQLNFIQLHYYNLLTWAGYLWFAFKRKLHYKK
jgi:GT2 family glycosyltransferase